MPYEYVSLKNLDDQKIVEGILSTPSFMNGMSWLNDAVERDFCFTVARKMFDPMRGSSELIDDSSKQLLVMTVEEISKIDSKTDPYRMAVQKLARIFLANEDSPMGYTPEVAWKRFENIRNVFIASEQYDKLPVIQSLGRYIGYYLPS